MFLETISILLIIILSPVILVAGIFILFGMVALICFIVSFIIIAIDWIGDTIDKFIGGIKNENND